MRQAWTTGSATLDGRYYTVDGAINRPLPLQEGGIPLWVAGGGEKVTLRIAAQYAQYTNCAGAAEAFDHKSAVLRTHCERLGTDFSAITRSANYNVMIGETEADVEKGLQRLEERVTPFLGAEGAASFVAEYRSPDALAVGTPAQIVDRLADMAARGMDYGIFYFPDAACDRSGIELFERKVLPALA